MTLEMYNDLVELKYRLEGVLAYFEKNNLNPRVEILINKLLREAESQLKNEHKWPEEHSAKFTKTVQAQECLKTTILDTPHGITLMHAGDFIVTDAAGNNHPYTKEQFYKEYQNYD